MTRFSHDRARRARRGFTLVELVVASIVGTLLAAATTSGISMMLRAKGAAAARHEAFSRADAAASRIAGDALAVVRDADLAQCRVRVDDSGSEASPGDSLFIRYRTTRQARSTDDAAEGGEYVAEYRLGTVSASDPRPSLWRRSDSAFRTTSDTGGTATRLADGISEISIEAYDGEQWYTTWDSDKDGLPHALRVLVKAVSKDARATAYARRVVAIDRTPVPLKPPEPPTTTNDTSKTDGKSTTPSSSGAGTGTGTTGRTIEIPAAPRPSTRPGGGTSGGGASGGGGSNGSGGSSGGGQRPGGGPR